MILIEAEPTSRSTAKSIACWFFRATILQPTPVCDRQLRATFIDWGG
jgi:hypothetical protein